MESEVVLVKADQHPRVWTSWQIFFGTLFGGFLGGCFLMRENYKAMEQAALSKKTLIAGILSTLLFFIPIVFLPEVLLDRILISLDMTIPFLCGCYILYEHYKAVHDWKLLKQTIIAAIIIPPIFIVVPLFLPEELLSLPRSLIFIMQALIIQGLAKSLQEKPIKELIVSGSKKYSNWRLFLITLISALGQLILFLLLYVASSLMYSQTP